jgi:hypothetical protein
MSAKSPIVTISTVVVIACSILGCRHTQQAIYNPSYRALALPSSFTLYLHVSNPSGAPEEIVKAMTENIAGSLLMRDIDVKNASDSYNERTDGMLLTIEILRAFRGGTSKRIDIRYQLINRSNNEVMLDEKDAISSKFGYNKITIAYGNKLSATISQLITSLKNRNVSHRIASPRD